MLIKKANDTPSSEITPRSAYLNRRSFMTGAAALGVAGMLDPQHALADGGAKL
jgi:methionine sulfoxide reductase catalytic subunit